MRITFLGAVENVTGSSYLIEADNKKILVDCGMFQGGKELKHRNFLPFYFNPLEIDFVLLTHAHIDHTGLVPKLVKDGFKNRIITTEATKALNSIMLPDSGHIQETENQWDNKKRKRKGEEPREPLYTVDEAVAALDFIEGVKYEEEITLTPNIHIRFRDAGHILGSAIIEMFITENGKTIKITFSGDLGNSTIPILCDPTIIEETDYLLIESTYGNRFHEEYVKNEELINQIINTSYENGGKLIIPSFAIGRTQTVLYHLNNLFNANKIPRITVYLDSPLAIKATKIYTKFKELYDKDARKILETDQNPFGFPGLKVSQSVQDSMAINLDESPSIIVSASGMCTAGRIKHHLKHNIWKPNSTVMFVGYQARGTLGRSILEKNKHIKILGERINVRANIQKINSFSAHADKGQLLDWVRGLKKAPQNIFIVHGEEEASKELSDSINTEFGYKTDIPTLYSSYELTKDKPTKYFIPKVELEKVTDDDIIKLEEELIELKVEFKEKVVNILKNTSTWSGNQSIDDGLKGLNIITDDILEMVQEITEFCFNEIAHEYISMLSERNIDDKDLNYRIRQFPQKQPLDYQFFMKDLRSHIYETFKISRKIAELKK